MVILIRKLNVFNEQAACKKLINTLKKAYFSVQKSIFFRCYGDGLRCIYLTVLANQFRFRS